MSDEVMQLSKRPAPPAPAPVVAVTLPYTVSLPTRFYNRIAVEEVARSFAEIASTETRVVEGAFEVTFKTLDPEAGEHVIDEFLNHALYRSATAGEEGAR